MTLFASVRPAVRPCGADDCVGCQTDEQHNPPNPILVDFRQKMQGRTPIGFNAPANWLQLIEIGSFTDASDTELQHARRVLTRLAQIGATV